MKSAPYRAQFAAYVLAMMADNIEHVISYWVVFQKFHSPALAGFAGRVSDSGEGRWTIKAAIDEAVPVPVLSTALYERFSSRGEADFANKVLSAMRYAFGGHLEKPADK